MCVCMCLVEAHGDNQIFSLALFSQLDKCSFVYFLMLFKGRGVMAFIVFFVVVK